MTIKYSLKTFFYREKVQVLEVNETSIRNILITMKASSVFNSSSIQMERLTWEINLHFTM